MQAWRQLGSHQLAAALLAVLALSATLGGTLPQSARLDARQQQGWQQEWSGGWLESLRLSDVFDAWWFWGLCLLLLLNLLAGIWQLAVRRVPGRDAGAWGLLLGHGGLLLLILGAMASALSGFGAHLELTEGEVWQGSASKLVIDRGQPQDFAAVLRLDRVRATVTEGRHLRELRLQVSWQEHGDMPRQGVISANNPLAIAGHRIYPDNTFGQSAVLERLLPDGERRLLLVHFPLPRNQWGSAQWQAEQSRTLQLGDGARHFRLRLQGEPAVLQLTVSRGNEQLFTGHLRPGDSADVGGERMTLRQVTPWAGVYLAVDHGAAWVFAGMLLAVLGFSMYLVRSARLPQQGGAR